MCAANARSRATPGAGLLVSIAIARAMAFAVTMLSRALGPGVLARPRAAETTLCRPLALVIANNANEYG
jgi:hypothetical protein